MSDVTNTNTDESSTKVLCDYIKTLTQIKSNDSELLQALERIQTHNMTCDILQQTMIGVTLNKFKKFTTNPAISNLCTQLIKQWKQVVVTSATASSARLPQTSSVQSKPSSPINISPSPTIISSTSTPFASNDEPSSSKPSSSSSSSSSSTSTTRSSSASSNNQDKPAPTTSSQKSTSSSKSIDSTELLKDSSARRKRASEQIESSRSASHTSNGSTVKSVPKRSKFEINSMRFSQSFSPTPSTTSSITKSNSPQASNTDNNISSKTSKSISKNTQLELSPNSTTRSLSPASPTKSTINNSNDRSNGKLSSDHITNGSSMHDLSPSNQLPLYTVDDTDDIDPMDSDLLVSPTPILRSKSPVVKIYNPNKAARLAEDYGGHMDARGKIDLTKRSKSRRVDDVSSIDDENTEMQISVDSSNCLPNNSSTNNLDTMEGLNLAGKVPGGVELCSLKDLCIDFLSINRNWEKVVRFPLLHHEDLRTIFGNATPEILQRVEANNEHLLDELDELWKPLVQKKFGSNINSNGKKWRDMWVNLHQEQIARLSQVSEKLKLRQAKEKEMKEKMAIQRVDSKQAMKLSVKKSRLKGPNGESSNTSVNSALKDNVGKQRLSNLRKESSRIQQTLYRR